MGNLFAGSEVVEIGVQIEINGKDFYNTLAGKTKNEKAREIFNFLAGEEEKHIATFERIRDSVERYKPPEAYPGEYFSYMNALASEHVFTQKNKGVEAANRTKGDKDAIELGIKFEKDSIIFYEGMKKVVPEKDLLLIDALIDQEKNHLMRLNAIKGDL